MTSGQIGIDRKSFFLFLNGLAVAAGIRQSSTIPSIHFCNLRRDGNSIFEQLDSSQNLSLLHRTATALVFDIQGLKTCSP